MCTKAASGQSCGVRQTVGAHHTQLCEVVIVGETMGHIPAARQHTSHLLGSTKVDSVLASLLAVALLGSIPRCRWAR